MPVLYSRKYYLSFFIFIFIALFGLNGFLFHPAEAQEFPFQLSINKKAETIIFMKLNYKDPDQISKNDFFSDPANVLKAMALATPSSVYAAEIKERPGGVLIVQEKDIRKTQKNLEKMLQIFNSAPSKKKTTFFISVLTIKDCPKIIHQQAGSLKLQNIKGQWEIRKLPVLDMDSYLNNKPQNHNSLKNLSEKTSNKYFSSLSQSLRVKNISQSSYSLSLIGAQDHLKFTSYNQLWIDKYIGTKLEQQLEENIFSVNKSPDGKKVAFIAADRQKYAATWPLANWNLYISNVDGNQVKKITSNLIATGQVIFYWSPDSNKVFYHQEDDSGTYNLYSFNLGSGQIKQLTRAGNCIASLVSPSGKRIAFLMPGEEYGENLYNLWTVNEDGLTPYLLAKNISSDLLSWSPDSNKLAFVRTRPSNQSNYTLASLGIAYANNKQPTKYITDFSFKEGELESSWLGQFLLAWSSDGNKIALTECKLNVSGNEIRDIYVLNLQDLSKKILTNNHRSSYPAISSSGNTVMFLEKDGNNENYIIWLANSSGKSARQLATGKSNNLYYTFSPEGNKIAFVSNNRLWVINLNSSGLTKLFDTDKYYNENTATYLKTGGKMILKNIQWSSDGSKIYCSWETFHPNYQNNKLPYASGSLVLNLEVN